MLDAGHSQLSANPGVALNPARQESHRVSRDRGGYDRIVETGRDDHRVGCRAWAVSKRYPIGDLAERLLDQLPRGKSRGARCRLVGFRVTVLVQPSELLC